MRLVLEGAVIVLSILAAFGLDAWWDRTQERQEEQETLLALEAEFASAREVILRYRSAQQRILRSVAAATDSLNRAHLEGRRTVSLPDSMLALAYIPPTTSVGLGTLRGLIASGRLVIIRDRELRTALGAWGIDLDELSEEEWDSRALAFGDMDRTLRARMSTYGLWETGERLIAGTETLEDRESRRQVPVDTEVLGVFYLRESLLRHGIDEFEDLVRAVDSVLELTRRSIEGR